MIILCRIFLLLLYVKELSLFHILLMRRMQKGEKSKPRLEGQQRQSSHRSEGRQLTTERAIRSIANPHVTFETLFLFPWLSPVILSMPSRKASAGKKEEEKEIESSFPDQLVPLLFVFNLSLPVSSSRHRNESSTRDDSPSFLSFSFSSPSFSYQKIAVHCKLFERTQKDVLSADYYAGQSKRITKNAYSLRKKRY